MKTQKILFVVLVMALVAVGFYALAPSEPERLKQSEHRAVDCITPAVFAPSDTVKAPTSDNQKVLDEVYSVLGRLTALENLLKNSARVYAEDHEEMKKLLRDQRPPVDMIMQLQKSVETLSKEAHEHDYRILDRLVSQKDSISNLRYHVVTCTEEIPWFTVAVLIGVLVSWHALKFLSRKIWQLIKKLTVRS